MVTKVKTFDELEQEAKQKRDYKREPKQEESSSSSDADVDCSADTDEPKHTESIEDESDAPAVVTTEGRKASSSSESEPELTQLKRRCWLRSLGKLDYSSAASFPTSIQHRLKFQSWRNTIPAHRFKQYPFKMNEDAQEDSDKSEEEKMINLAYLKTVMLFPLMDQRYLMMIWMEILINQNFVIALGVRLGVLPTQPLLSLQVSTVPLVTCQWAASYP